MKKNVLRIFFLGFTVSKTEKKNDKINFNKFIWLYWKVKNIYMYIFGWFSNSWNEKKYMLKKKSAETKLLGYCPFPSCVSHDTVDCIVTQGVHGQAGLATIRLD